jgi:hypothetical protein
MKIKLIVVCMLFMATFPLSAQDWSTWSNANHRDVQYRWLAATPTESGACYLELRDLKRQPNETTLVTVLIDYQSAQAESTREVIAIANSNDAEPGPSILRPCVSIGNVHVKDMVRCETSGCAANGWPWL